jgi:hypothetical protein
VQLAQLSRSKDLTVKKNPIPGCHFNDVKAVVMRELAPAGVDWEQCQGSSKGERIPVTFARRMIAYLSYTCTSMSYPEITKAMRVKAVSHSGAHGQVAAIGRMIDGDEDARWLPRCAGMVEVMADFRAMVREEVSRRQEVSRAS